MKRALSVLVFGLLAVGGWLVPRAARAAPAQVVYVLAIGNNALPIDPRAVTSETPR